MSKRYKKKDLKGKARKLSMIVNQRYDCVWCGGLMQITRCEDDDYATYEHLIPKSFGCLEYIKEFPGEKHNLAIAHKACNNLRGSDLSWMPAIPLSKPQERALRYAQYKAGIRNTVSRVGFKAQRKSANKPRKNRKKK